MKFALFSNERKPQALEIRRDLARHLTECGAKVLIETNDCASELSLPEVQKCFHSCDFVVSIGGDGSILHLSHRLKIPHPPLIGVNLGTLGFLADIPVQDVFGSFSAICHKAYKISERIVIDGSINNNSVGFAINEVMLHRGYNPHIVDIAIHVDGSFLNTFSADGILISTPSGSTAYSLSAGGPILTPETKALVITPICPHTISNRPIVLLPQKSLSLELFHGAEAIDLSFDGQKPIKLARGERVDISIQTLLNLCYSLQATIFRRYALNSIGQEVYECKWNYPLNQKSLFRCAFILILFPHHASQK
jgi:NAD+ kinase